MNSENERVITALSILAISVLIISWSIDNYTDINFSNDSFTIHIRDIIMMSAITSLPFISAILFLTFASSWLRYTSFVLNALFSMFGALTAFNYIFGSPPLVFASTIGASLLFPVAAILAVLLLRVR